MKPFKRLVAGTHGPNTIRYHTNKPTRAGNYLSTTHETNTTNTSTSLYADGSNDCSGWNSFLCYRLYFSCFSKLVESFDSLEQETIQNNWIESDALREKITILHIYHLNVWDGVGRKTQIFQRKMTKEMERFQESTYCRASDIAAKPSTRQSHLT